MFQPNIILLNMATTKKLSDYSSSAISAKLESLFQLQLIDSKIDKLKTLRGELPLEVTDLSLNLKN